MTRDEAIRKTVEILAESCRPELIYLIGSSARGEAAPHSDIDFVVVLPDDADQARLWASNAFEALWDIPFAVEFVPFRRSTFDRRSNWVMSLPSIAISEGRLLYDSRQRAA